MQPFAIPSVILSVIAVPLVFGWVGRNRYYGMRTQETLSSDAIWYRANRLAGIALMLGTAFYGVLSTRWPYDRLADNSFQIWLIHLALFVLPIALGLTLSVWYSKRLSA
jgi:uncharacterized membrane protein